MRGNNIFFGIWLTIASLARAIHNPIISGWNPDPSILRVQDDYYIATSSFEYFPGIPIYKSMNRWSSRLDSNHVEEYLTWEQAVTCPIGP